MTCHNCGTQNEAGRKFCRECGVRLAVTCPACGRANAPEDKFCGECGSPLGAAAAQASGASATDSAGPVIGETRAAERRLVSVLFADLVGFTTLAESRDPETVRELQAKYFDAASQVIGRYGGSIEKYVGDAVMAIWGAPTAHEDDAERSVRAALDLVEAVAQMGQELGAELTARAAVLTGEAAVTLGAANQGMVSGDLVNTASRLQAVAPPGSVLVGETTFRAASGAIAFEPAGEQDLKGKVAPVTSYRALRVVARRGGAGRSEQLEGPFVGRQAELRMLKEFHLATGAERRPRLVSIMGQAGIGKSRLVWEFQKYLDGVTELVYWHQGRSPAYGDGITFWALAEMVRSRAGITEGEEPAAMRAKLVETVGTWVTDETERRWIEPRLLQLLGLEASSGDGGDRESLFAAWRTFFERIAERAVVVLVFEDLQWADGGLLDFIDHVLEWSRDRPIYVISMARPELLDRRPDWGAGRRNFTSLVLEPLSDVEMRELLAGLVPGLPEAAVSVILERAEGVPLYAVETVRMLLSDGRLERDDGAYRPVGDLRELSVPPSLQALVAARLDALEAKDRALLQAASVIGKTFTIEALAAVSGVPAEEVATRLRALVRRELLVLDVDPRSPERGQYGFVQAVIREVAYATLARRDRRRLHVSAARHFETLDDEGIAGVLAEHYLSAYRAQPEGPEGEAVAAQARVALRGAAERASALGSLRQAATYLERAIEVTTDPLEAADFHAAAAKALTNAGGFDLATPHAERALELVRPLGDRGRVLRAIVGVAFNRDVVGRLSDGVALLEEAAREFEDLADSRHYVHLMAELARANLLLKRSQRCLELVDATLPSAERMELTRDVLELLVTRGAALADVRRIKEAIVTLEGAVGMARSHGMSVEELRARVNLSYAAAAEDIVMSYRVAREGYELSQRLGLGGPGYWLLGNAVDAAIRIGDWEWAAAQSEEALGNDPDAHPVARLQRIHIRGLLGEPIDADLEALPPPPDLEAAIAFQEEIRSDVLLARGEFEEARRLATSSFARSHAPDSTALLRSARLACWLGDLSGAVTTHATMAEIPGRVQAAGRSELEAGIAALEGREPDARAGFADALRAWRDLGARFELAMTQLDLVTMLGPESADAREAAEEARTIFQGLRAEQHLRLLDRALTAPRPRAPVRAAKPEAAKEAPTPR
ncbi:MAG: adenylate/guanylate cyclase domain-containing protein [Chloroflexota bacterium]